MRYPDNRARTAFVPRTSTRGPLPRLSASLLAPLAVVCTITASGCGQTRGDEVPRGLLGELARELDRVPLIAPRLSISSEQPSCIPTQVQAPAWSRVGCAAAPTSRRRSSRIAAIVARAGHAVRDRADPHAMHAAALIDLLYETEAGKSLQRSISSLQTAARLSERPAPPLADVAAAYLVRAERARTPRDLLAAIEAAAEALEHEPKNLAALYNLALALERFGLIEEAAGAWRDYLAADAASGWATEARRHLDQVLAIHTEPAPPVPDAPLPTYRAYAAAEPQQARELGWCRVLGAWADAALAGDEALAEAHLQRAEVLGNALEERLGGDATLTDGVRAIRANNDRALAIAHREFAAGCRLHDRVEFRAAVPRFEAAAANAAASPSLASWARLLHGAMVFYSGDRQTGERVFRQVVTETDTMRHPALAGRARLLLSALLVRNDRYDGALEEGRRAEALLGRAGEWENEGAAIDAMAVAQFARRDVDEGYVLAQRALWQLRPYRASYRLHNVLLVNGRFVANDGFPRGAVLMQSEGVRVANRNGIPAFVAEAHLARAQLKARIGDLAGASQDAALGRSAAAAITDPAVRGWMTALWRMAISASLLRSDPRGAADALDSAATFLLGMKAPFVAMPAVVGGAEARIAAGDGAAARARLEIALAMLEQRRDSVRMEPRRAAVFETARGVVDRITALELAAGRTAGALAYLDRGRESLAPVGRRHAGTGGILSWPPGEVALELAVIGDTLLAWTVSGQQVELSRTQIDTVWLTRTVTSLREQLEASAGEQAILSVLARLYDVLIRPVTRHLGATGTPVVIVADGPVASIPFAALFDTRRKRYLVEDHPLRFAPSLRDAQRPPRRPATGGGAVFVADPTFDPVANPGFEQLGGAAAEVRELVAKYQAPEVLSGTGANLASLQAALAGARMVHYAGHAVFDDERPERSYLLLAPLPGNPGSGRLEAGEIAQLDLRHLAVVVLAACQTVRTGPGRAAGLSGLAGAFIAAGAGGAVGSLWEVDDERTRPLMVAFHQAYRATGDGPAALRAGQLELLRSRDEALRSPATWAAFRYVGS